MTDIAKAEAEKSLQEHSLLWKIWTFPLVVMVVALGLAALAILIPIELLKAYLPEDIDINLRDVITTLVTITSLVVVYKLIIRRLGRHPKDDLPAKGAFTDTMLGIAIGAGLISAVVGIAAVSGTYRIVGMGSWDDFLTILLMTGVTAGFFEEIILRGIIFRWMEEFGGSWLALIVSSAIFGFGHAGNDNATWFSSLAIAFEAGILLGGAYMLTRSLWLAIGIHAGWNVAQGFIWDVPVSGFAYEGLVEAELYGPAWLSGGAFGLEASVIGLLVATAAGVWTVWQANKAGHWIKPMWSKSRG